MKKPIVLGAMLLLLTTSITAQIPNNGFENWSTYGNGMLPTGWWSANDSLSSSGSYFPVTRSTDHYPASVGSYSIRLESNPSLSLMWAKAGLAWPGSWDGNNDPSFKITGHPIALCGYYKYAPQNGDSACIFLELFKNGSSITGVYYRSGKAVSTWTPFKLYVSDTLYASADSARIMLSSFDVDQGPSNIHGNSVLYVDNLSLDTFITSGPATVKNINDAISLFSLYPNPAGNSYHIQWRGTDVNDPYYYMFNVSGLMVKTGTIKKGDNVIDVIDLPTGIYHVAIRSTNFLTAQKLVILR